MMPTPLAPEATPEEVDAYMKAVDAYLASVNYKLTVTLRTPVVLGETFSKLELREPTAGEWAQWSGLRGIDSDIRAVSVVSGLPEPAVRQIGARDLATAARFIALFLI